MFLCMILLGGGQSNLGWTSLKKNIANNTFILVLVSVFKPFSNEFESDLHLIACDGLLQDLIYSVAIFLNGKGIDLAYF